MRFELCVPNAVHGWTGEQGRRARSLPSWRSRSAASHSLGSGHKGNRAPRELGRAEDPETLLWQVRCRLLMSPLVLVGGQ